MQGDKEKKKQLQKKTWNNINIPRDIRRHFMKKWTGDYIKGTFRRQEGALGN